VTGDEQERRPGAGALVVELDGPVASGGHADLAEMIGTDHPVEGDLASGLALFP
jgi:hypothetical protein